MLPILVDNGFEVVCSVRDIHKFNPEKSIRKKIKVIENDLTKSESLNNIPSDIEIAYHLVHSMSTSKHFDQLEKQSAVNFRKSLQNTKIKQVIYLSDK